MKNIALLITLFCLFGCGFEINTTDPQFSPSINQSKKDSLFLYELKCLSNEHSFLKFGKIWIEYCWKNEVKGGKSRVKRTEGMQLVFQILEYEKPLLKEDSYHIDWSMKELNSGFVGKSNKIYFLFLKNIKMEEVYNIGIIKDKERMIIDTIAFSISTQKR